MSAETLGARLERVCELALAASIFSWAFSSLFHSGRIPRVAGLTLALVNFVVATLLVWRRPATQHGDGRALLAALPSVVIGYVMYQVAPRVWPVAALVVFVLSGLFTACALICLGRSFAIMPALRKLEQRGLYRWVRHPVYLGEFAMLIAASATAGAHVAVVVALATFAVLIPRMHAEERVLASDPEYQAYCERVRYRLLPLLY